MNEVSSRSFLHFLSDIDEHICRHLTIPSVPEMFMDIWKQAVGIIEEHKCNLVLVGTDSLCVKPVQIFGRFSEFRLFTPAESPLPIQTDPILGDWNGDWTYMSSGTVYFPHSAAEALIPLFRQYIELGSQYSDIYDYDQYFVNRIFYSQPPVACHPNEFYWDLNYNEPVERNNFTIPIPRSEAKIVHFHASRNADLALSKMREEWANVSKRMISGLVSVILPTTGRKDRVVACVEQLFRTVGNREIEVICPVDCDPDTAHTLELMNDSQHNIAVLYSDGYQGCARSWNSGLAVSRGEYIVFAADDVWFESGWLEESLRVMSTLPEGIGLVGFNDRHMDGKIVGTHYIAHRKFILDYMGGCLGFEAYSYCCNDLEATERAKRAGRYAWAENAHVRHDHPAHGTRPDDENDIRHRPLAQQDNDTFFRRQDEGFPDDMERVISE